MIKVQQRELLISHKRHNCCTIISGRFGLETCKRDIPSDVVNLFKQEPILLSSVSSIQHASENNQELLSTQQQEDKLEKSRKFLKKLNKITKDDSYGKRRKCPPLSYQLCDLPINVASLDMEWNDFETVLKTTMHFRRLLAIEVNPPIDQVIQSGAVLYLLQYLDLDHIQKFYHITDSSGLDINNSAGKESIFQSNLHQLQLEATWAITNIASGSPEHTKYVVELDCIPRLIELLDSESEDVKQQSVWALGNISGDSETMRDLVLHHGAMPKVLKQLENVSNCTLTRNSTWTLSNLLRGSSPPWEIVSLAIPVLKKLLYHLDDYVLMDACWAISYICVGTHEDVAEIIEHDGVTRRIIEILHHSNPAVQTPALRIIGNLVSGTDSQTTNVLKNGFLNGLERLLANPKRTIRKELLWTLSNITAGNQEHIQIVIESDIIPKIISLIASGTEIYEVVKEGFWALSNLCQNGNEAQIEYAVKHGIVASFCYGLKLDSTIIELSLESLSTLLLEKYQNVHESVISNVKECGGLDSLFELMQSNLPKRIKNLSMTILENFSCPEELAIEIGSKSI